MVDHPLRVGLSMDARVDISNTDGRMLADGSAPPGVVQTHVYAKDDSDADNLVRRVIAANGGGSATAVVRPAAAASGAVPVK